MPVFVDGRNGKKTISTSKPLTALRKKHNERKSYVLMQTDWALYSSSASTSALNAVSVDPNGSSIT